jgi:cellulose synthase/poly-beta-1,6-N-acetylglucosamine synthase-like glycosyltransferase
MKCLGSLDGEANPGMDTVKLWPLQQAVVMSITEFPAESVESGTVERFQESKVDGAWPPFDWPAQPVRVVSPARSELFKLRGLIVVGTVSVLALLWWLLSPARFGDPLVYFGLTVAVLLRAICRLFEWYNYWAIKIPPVVKPKRQWEVDVLTTACPGEPRGMIVRTLKAMTRIEYPHTNYLCDEGNDPYLRQVCEELGVVHITRSVKTNAKAGNINNALKQATGEIAVVLDPDHEPSPYLLDRTLGYFEDEQVGFVQSVQAYRNQDDSFVARGAAEQSYHFYGPHMMGTFGRGTTQAIGANCVFRRSALDSIGGHAAGLAEDMHTSMRLYATGWKSVYVPEVLTRGLVPSTLAAYYKQQLKWSCGVFNLLFEEYPLICRKFTLSQRIHFLLCPLFFLRGLIGMLEILVPMACLVFGFIAWRATMPQIVFWFLPVVGFSTLIHLRVQRWLIEPHERGLHLAGGLLTIASWWIYLAGFFCALFRIKVPYIPTPKEGEATDAVAITGPNFLVAAVLIAAAVWGIYLDSSPYAFFMAAIALINAFALILVSLAAQQLTVHRVIRSIRSLRVIFLPISALFRAAMSIYSAALNRIREGYLLPAVWVLAIGAACFALMPHPPVAESNPANVEPPAKDVGGFYCGIDQRAIANAELMPHLSAIQQKLGYSFRIVSFDQHWGPQNDFPLDSMQQLRRAGAMPFMNWLPSDDAVDSTNGMPLSTEPMLRAIRFGKYDGYLTDFAEKVRRFGEPVFISFAPQQDDPQMPWSRREDGTNSSIDFAEAWKHIAVIFREQGAANVAWVWTPATPAAIESDNPLELEYIQWIGVPASGGGGASPFAQQYEAFRSKIAKWHLPVMIDDLSATNDESGSQWIKKTMSSIAGQYPEIKGVVLSSNLPQAGSEVSPRAGSDADTSSQLSSLFHDALQSKPLIDGSARTDDTPGSLWFDLKPGQFQSHCVTGQEGNFSLIVDGSPFYIKGVVYNPGHDWRDGELPLTRRQLDQDFDEIHAMGGNTIRRYGTNYSDRNIFNAAAANQLKVMYGFWLPQDANYLTDTAKLKMCEDEIESTVRSYHHHPGLLGWCLGNEVWGLLKHKYAQPYLTEVRHAEVLFVERMARRIRELDPEHPIFCAQESFDVSGAVSDYAIGAPSLDAMCVNSYYEQEIAHLDLAVTHVDSKRPYIVSEFGPDGYWDDKYNHRDEQNGLVEATSMYKAWLYANRWREYIQRNKGRDVGGVAYCWTDRSEGTSTWFGMNDLDGRQKPACAALASAWNNPDPMQFGTFPYNGPKIMDVSYPTQPIHPHEAFTVHATVDTVNGDKTSYIWTVEGPDFATDEATINPTDNGDSATIVLPDKPGWYRVHVKVIDREGLDETSVPVKLQADGK